MAKVILTCGLPGTGKSALAEELAKALSLPLFSKDVLEASILESGVLPKEQLNGVGYVLLKNLVNEHLKRQSSVIVDFTADRNRVNELWPELLTKNLTVIECVCSDTAEHKRRIESRKRNITGWYELSWQEVEEISTRYTPLVSNRLVLDTIQSSSSLLANALSYVSN